MSEHQDFTAFSDERYPDCTLTQKLEVYLQHHPRRAVPLLEELLGDKDRLGEDVHVLHSMRFLERERLKNIAEILHTVNKTQLINWQTSHLRNLFHGAIAQADGSKQTDGRTD